jgi:choline kinase
MRAILLCAGRGSRLDPLTRDQPKCLVEVAGMPILQHQLNALYASGIDDIAVVGGYHMAKIRNYVRRAGMSVSLLFNPFWAVSNSIGSVWFARYLLNEDFCLLNGDAVIADAVMQQALQMTKRGVNLVVERPDACEADDMRVVVSGTLIERVGKHLPSEHAECRSLGIVLCRREGAKAYRAVLAELVAEDTGVLHFHHDVIDRLARRMPVHAVELESPRWGEIDTQADIVAVERQLGIETAADPTADVAFRLSSM